MILCAALTWPARAEPEIAVDVELVLAVDVSRSMTVRELEIQRRGYAEALVSDAVIEAIGRGGLGRVAITYLEWAGASSQQVIVDWTLITNRSDAQAFADRLTAHFVDNMRRTSISGALDYAAGLFQGNDFKGDRWVIDVSGDGPNNQGRPVNIARDDALAQGIIINGLPLMTREGMGAQWHLDDLDRYYQDCVIGGPGAFVIPVLEWDHFPAAVQRKLVLDLVEAPRRPGPLRIPAQSEHYDCLIGEKIWDNIQGDWN